MQNIWELEYRLVLCGKRLTEFKIKSSRGLV